MPKNDGALNHVDLRLVKSYDDVADFLEWLGRSREILGIDTETGGFDFHRDELRLVQFGDLDKGWAIPWHRWSGLAIEAIKRYDKPVVFHNAPFDVKFLLQNAPELGRWRWELTHDTMTMYHLMNPLRPKGLKPLGSMYVDSSAANAQRMLAADMSTNKWTWATVPYDFPRYWIYGAMDPVLTCHLFKRAKSEVINGSASAAYALEMGVLRVLTNMMMKGARIDLDYSRMKITELNMYVSEVMDYIGAQYGVKSTMSADQLGRAFGGLGVDVPRKITRGGQQSWDKEVLSLIDHDLARYVLAVRKIQKQIGPYLQNFLEMAVDGRVHPTIWATGARTSRMTMQDPALQTLPRDDPLVRNAFIPSDGCSLISIDADQIEARLAAHFSGDRGLIDAFHQPVDFFVVLLRELYHDDAIVKSDLRRGPMKNSIYGRIYGAGTETMARAAKVSVEEMWSLRTAFDQRYPGLDRLAYAINDAAKQRQRDEGMSYIVTPYGRRLMSDEDHEYALLNYLIQGHAAEILKKNLLELDASGLGEYLILPVHDEILFDVPADDAKDVLREAEQVMTDTENYAVPITWSGEIMTKRWGEKYEK